MSTRDRHDRADNPFIVHAAGGGVVGARRRTAILIILLIFVAQNTGSVTAHFLVFHWNLPVGVGYLLSAVAGATTTVLVGAARMIQLRRAAKKNIRPL